MSDFRSLTDRFSASPQLTEEDVARASELGFSVIVNNRPEDEASDQTPGPAIEKACRDHGLGYVAIPIAHAAFSEAQVNGMAQVLRGSEGPVLAYCRSGTRSTYLWALAQVRLGQNPASVAAQADAAGYDLGPIIPLIDVLAAAPRD